MAARGQVRSYEEIEKRRSGELAGEEGSSRGRMIILLVFLAFAALTIYLLAGSLVGLAPPTSVVPEVTALVAAGALFAYRMQTRRGRAPGGSVRPALVDALVFLGILGLAAWTFVFPLLYPLPQQTAVIGVYSLILIAAMIVVLRFASPGLRGRSDDGYADIEASLKRLGKAVDQLSRRVPQGEKNVDPAVAERLATMMGEVASMKKELSSIKAGGGPASGTSSVSSVRVYAPSAKPVLVPRERVQPAAAGPSAARPEGGARWSAEDGISVPDSTVNNPWLDVLSKRRAKREAPAGPGSDA